MISYTRTLRFMCGDVRLTEIRSEDDASQYLEDARWPTGLDCPHCSHPKIYRLQRYPRRLYKCGKCRKHFSLRIQFPFLQDSKIPLRKWLYAFYLISASNGEISAYRISIRAGISYPSAWKFKKHIVPVLMKVNQAFDQMQKVDWKLGNKKARGREAAERLVVKSVK